MLEDKRKHSKFVVCTERGKCLKQISKSTFQDVNIISENCVIIKHVQSSICLDKAIYVGLSILDLSKLDMLEFWYGQVLKTFNHADVKLLTLDTDSFLFSVSYDLEKNPEANFWQDYANMAPKLDTSSYDPDTHPFFLNNNQMLDELLFHR